jgi:hypothetical protein
MVESGRIQVILAGIKIIFSKAKKLLKFKNYWPITLAGGGKIKTMTNPDFLINPATSLNRVILEN